jgi:hypothetical protein
MQDKFDRILKIRHAAYRELSDMEGCSPRQLSSSYTKYKIKERAYFVSAFYATVRETPLPLY